MNLPGSEVGPQKTQLSATQRRLAQIGMPRQVLLKAVALLLREPQQHAVVGNHAGPGLAEVVNQPGMGNDRLHPLRDDRGRAAGIGGGDFTAQQPVGTEQAAIPVETAMKIALCTGAEKAGSLRTRHVDLGMLTQVAMQAAGAGFGRAHGNKVGQPSGGCVGRVGYGWGFPTGLATGNSHRKIEETGKAGFDTEPSGEPPGIRRFQPIAGWKPDEQ